MKIDLEVLASTNIKRKKPWPMITWLGEEHESIFLMDQSRISVLYVPSGKTKKKVSKLSPFMQDVIVMNYSQNGHYILGLLKSGNIFLWNKDTDILRMIHGLDSFVSNTVLNNVRSELFVSNDGRQVLVAVGCNDILFWEQDNTERLSESKSTAVKGLWHRIIPPEGFLLPKSDNKEISVHCMFYNHQVLGHCCQCSLVFNGNENMCAVTLVLKFNITVHTGRNSTKNFQEEWSLLQYPVNRINSGCESLHMRGAYVSKYSNNGLILAVGSNQMSPKSTSLLYLSVLTETVLVTDMKSCGVGADLSRKGKHFWISDMNWTQDDLFLTCILKTGSVCLLSRLGEPILIQSHGLSVDLGPSYFLPLHPVMIISSESELTDTGKFENPLQQRFSVSTHPRFPLIIFSDGYMITVLQLPSSLNPLVLTRNLVLETSRHLEKISDQESLNLTVVDAYNLPSDRNKNGKKIGKNEQKIRKLVYKFEEMDATLNSTQDSEISFVDEHNDIALGNLGDLSSGKIQFGEPGLAAEDMNLTFSGLNAMESLLKHIETSQSNLSNAWKICVSESDKWMVDMDSVSKAVIKNIIKLFTVILECVNVANVLPNLCGGDSPAQNSRLFYVIRTFRNIIELLQFDTFCQHLLPASLKFTHETVKLVLESEEIVQSDPRLKTLSGCYTLLRFTEKAFNKTYSWIPSDNTGTHQPFHNLADQSQGYREIPLQRQNSLPGKRLVSGWKLLYKHLLKYSKQRSTTITNEEHNQLQQVIYATQKCIQDAEGEIPIQAKKLTSGDKLSLDGAHSMAVGAWKDQLRIVEGNGNKKTTSKVLHSVLYTHLLNSELKFAMDFIDTLILQSTTNLEEDIVHENEINSTLSLMTIVTHTLKSQANSDQERVPCIRDKAIRQVVQSFARYMAAYFSNQSIFIFPPHNPQPLPALHFPTTVTNNRIIPKYHEDITNIVRRNNLGELWTTERTVEYLLLSGLFCESVWFADKMGDWKTAFLLSVAVAKHKEITPYLYQSQLKPLLLPENLLPRNILVDKLNVLITPNHNKQQNSEIEDYIPITGETNLSQLTKTLQDIFTAGVVSHVDIVPSLICQLVEKLQEVVSNFPALVPEGFYLPAPPLYCPQPSSDKEMRKSHDVEQEEKFRKKTSSIVQLILSMLNASNLSLPLSAWYVHQLTMVQGKAAQFKVTTEGPCLNLPEIIKQYNSYTSSIVGYQNTDSVNRIMASFQDFCSILWFLHARDKLSLGLRKRQMNMEMQEFDGDEKRIEDESLWQKECFASLQWCVHVIAFSKFIEDEGTVYKIFLSLLKELPTCEDTADILAEHFYNANYLDPEVQEKLDQILLDWQRHIIEPEDDGKSARIVVEEEDDEGDMDGRKSVTFLKASPKGKSLSVYFDKQCMVYQKVLKKRKKCFGRYNEFVFEMNNAPRHEHVLKKINIGSRPFESKVSFIDFLDTFLAVTFSKLTHSDNTHDKSNPLLVIFANQICEQEFKNLSSKSVGSFSRQQSLSILTPRSKFTKSNSDDIGMGLVSQDAATTPRGRNAKRGLFRSASSGETVAEKINVNVVDINRRNSDGTVYQRKDSSNTVLHMNEMPNKFSQSEEALHKETSVQDVGFSLDVDFGKRYLNIQETLIWLSLWGNKQHVLGLNWKGEHSLGLRPIMKIQTPPQMVVMALWLVENKYSSSNTRAARHVQDQVVRHSLDSNSSIDADVPPQSKQRNHHERKKALKKQQRLSGDYAESGHESPNRPPSILKNSLEERRSPNRPTSILRNSIEDHGNANLHISYDEEFAQVTNAYEKVLDSNNESSSLEVSSLASDELDGELKHTLSIIRGTGSLGKKSSTLNNVIFRGSHSPDRLRNSQRITLPHQSRSSVPRRSSSLQKHEHYSSSRERSLSRSTSPPHHRVSIKGQHVDRNLRNSINRSASTSPPRSKKNAYHSGQRHSSPSGVDRKQTDISTQLKHVVRGELKRMMEVQHRSMMAMIGALDETGNPQDQMRYSSAFDQSAKLQKESLRSSLGSKATLHLEDLDSSPPHRNLPHPPLKKGVLSELHNLQQSTYPQPSGFSSRPRRFQVENKENAVPVHKEIQARISALFSNTPQSDGNWASGPEFLKNSHDGGFKLPLLPQEAWGEEQSMKYESNFGIKIPLLHLDNSISKSHYFKGYQKPPSDYPPFLQQTPPPSYYPPSQSSVPQHLPPSDTIQKNVLHDQGQLFGIPLLQIKDKEPLPMQQGRIQQFGHLLPSEHLIAQHQEKRHEEESKQRYAREFHEQYVEAKEEFESQKFGQQLLHLDPKSSGTEVLRSPRRRKQEKHAVKKIVTPRAKSPIKELETHVSPRKVQEEKDDEEEDDVIEQEEIVENEIEEEESESEEEEMDDGYAIQPGMFDAFLLFQKELGGAASSNADLQYRFAMKMQKELAKRKRKKVDFSTNTRETQDLEMITDEEPVRRADAATSITKDTGVDPIQEAVIEYNKSRQGNVLPPDIYMGLRFGDTEEQNAEIPSNEKSKGRAYLNVVDINANDVLKELSKKPEEQSKARQDIGFVPDSRGLSAREQKEIAAIEESLRESYEPKPVGYDPVTVKMFESKHGKQGERVSVAVMPRESLTQSKSTMFKRLKDMNEQMVAIDQMSNHMDREFQNTRLLLNTIECIGEAMSPQEEQPEMSPRKRDKSSSPSRSPTPHSMVSESMESLKPRSSRRSPQLSRRTPEPSYRSKELQHISGLSGLTDIIGDMISKGQINAEDTGISQEELWQISRDIERDGDITASVERLQARMKGSQFKTVQRDPEERKELLDWMSQKKAKQMQEYKMKLKELREHEVKPFKSKGIEAKTITRHRQLQDIDKDNQELRKMQEKANALTRVKDTEELLVSLLTDRPQLPPEPIISMVSKKTKSISPERSPLGKTRTIKPRPASYRGVKSGGVSKPKSEKSLLLSKDLVEREFSLADVEHLFEKEDDLKKYGKEDATVRNSFGQFSDVLETVREESLSGRDELRHPHEESIPLKPYKPVPFSKIVKLQRPEITRREPLPTSTKTYVERLADMPGSTANTARESTDRQKIYGSSRIPVPKDKATIPRHVKTYAERLKEMKSERKYSGPIVSYKRYTPRTDTTVSMQRTVKKSGPPHKPVAYVDRLKKLNEGTHKPRGTSTITIEKPVIRKKLGPKHKPKTYVEQLQTLNANAAAMKQTYKKTRPRPYVDPYSFEDSEAVSVLSDWSVEDNVKRLLYEDESAYGISAAASMDFTAISDQRSDYYDYVMADEYSASVDIDDIVRIADAVSVSSGSVMSVIDWDAVDNLISDIK